MNKSKIQFAIASFVKNKKNNAAYYNDNWAERKERKAWLGIYGKLYESIAA